MDDLVSQVSIISHKLKAPLSNICTGSQILLDGLVGELTEEQKKIVQKIFDNSIKGIQYIEEYLEHGDQKN